MFIWSASEHTVEAWIQEFFSSSQRTLRPRFDFVNCWTSEMATLCRPVCRLTSTTSSTNCRPLITLNSPQDLSASDGEPTNCVALKEMLRVSEMWPTALGARRCDRTTIDDQSDGRRTMQRVWEPACSADSRLRSDCSVGCGLRLRQVPSSLSMDRESAEADDAHRAA